LVTIYSASGRLPEDHNVVVKISIVEDKKKKQSSLEVKYRDLYSVLNSRPA